MKKEFVIEREGKTFVLYAGLLDVAHQQGLKLIQTSLVQVPTVENGHVAICHATVETERGTFSGLGDASPENVPRMMRPHLIRMAETRAKARALRDAVNVGVAALEELGEGEVASEPEPRAAPDGKGVPEATRPRAAGPPARSEGTGEGRDQPTPPATAAQLRAIHSIASERLRLTDQELDERAVSLVGRRVAELSKSQASKLIDALRGR